jgi:hypothetical protein
MKTTTQPAGETAGEVLELARVCLEAAVIAQRLDQGAADRAMDRCQRWTEQAGGVLRDFAHVSWAHRGLVLALLWSPDPAEAGPGTPHHGPAAAS